MYTILWREAGEDKWDRLESEEEVNQLLLELKDNPDVTEGDVWIFTPEADEYAVEFDFWYAEKLNTMDNKQTDISNAYPVKQNLANKIQSANKKVIKQDIKAVKNMEQEH